MTVLRARRFLAATGAALMLPGLLTAPTAAAFNGVAANVLQDLLSQGVGGAGGGNLSGGSPDMVRLQALIGYHVIPGVALFVLVLGINLLGDGLRDAFATRSRT